MRCHFRADAAVFAASVVCAVRDAQQRCAASATLSCDGADLLRGAPLFSLIAVVATFDICRMRLRHAAAFLRAILFDDARDFYAAI